MGPAKVLLTAEEFDNYPFEEDKRYELDEGEFIVSDRPGYNHNRVVQRLTVALAGYFRIQPIGEVLISENVYALSPSTRRSPDAAVILGDRKSELWDATVIHIIPEIVAEVLEPGEPIASIEHKLHQYFNAGVKEVWTVSLDTREAGLWTGPRRPTFEFDGDATFFSAQLPGFQMPLETLFS